MTSKTSGSSKIGFAIGNILRLVADRYPTLLAMVMEIIQNMIDADATEGEITIDLGKSRISAVDNGRGCSREQFDEVIREIGRSQKSGKTGEGFRYLGQFGIAIVAPVTKCASYSFISAPREGKGQKSWEGYSEHRFDEVISDSQGLLGEIPWYPWPEKQRPLEKWNTYVFIRRIKRDKALRANLTLDRICNDAGVRFGEALRQRAQAKKPCRITVRFIDGKNVDSRLIEPLDFSGRKLNPYPITIEDTEAGKISLYLHLNDQGGGKRLVVQTGRSDFQIEWSKVAATAGWMASDSVKEVLGSGYFEGRILVDKGEWNPERTGLKESDEATMAFFAQLEGWCQSEGLRLIHDLRGQDRKSRYSQLALQVKSMIDSALKSGLDVLEICMANLSGAVSDGHEPVDGEDGPNMRSQPSGEKSGQGDKEKGKGNKRGHYDGKVHTGVVDEDGTPRTRSKKQPGFTIEIDEMPGSNERFEVLPNGTILVNCRHEDFAACEEATGKTDARLRRYIHLIALFALATMAMPPSSREAITPFEAAFIKLQVWTIREGSKAESSARSRFPVGD